MKASQLPPSLWSFLVRPLPQSVAARGAETSALLRPSPAAIDALPAGVGASARALHQQAGAGASLDESASRLGEAILHGDTDKALAAARQLDERARAMSLMRPTGFEAGERVSGARMLALALTSPGRFGEPLLPLLCRLAGRADWPDLAPSALLTEPPYGLTQPLDEARTTALNDVHGGIRPEGAQLVNGAYRLRNETLLRSIHRLLKTYGEALEALPPFAERCMARGLWLPPSLLTQLKPGTTLPLTGPLSGTPQGHTPYPGNVVLNLQLPADTGPVARAVGVYNRHQSEVVLPPGDYRATVSSVEHRRAPGDWLADHRAVTSSGQRWQPHVPVTIVAATIEPTQRSPTPAELPGRWR